MSLRANLLDSRKLYMFSSTPTSNEYIFLFAFGPGKISSKCHILRLCFIITKTKAFSNRLLTVIFKCISKANHSARHTILFRVNNTCFLASRDVLD